MRWKLTSVIIITWHKKDRMTATLNPITPPPPHAALTLSKTVAWSNFLPRSLKIVSEKKQPDSNELLNQRLQ